MRLRPWEKKRLAEVEAQAAVDYHGESRGIGCDRHIAYNPECVACSDVARQYREMQALITGKTSSGPMDDLRPAGISDAEWERRIDRLLEECGCLPGGSK